MKTGRNISNLATMAVLVLAVVGIAGAQIIYVDTDAAGANDGSSWADAYKYLQDGLAAASSGDQIWVAARALTDRIRAQVLRPVIGRQPCNCQVVLVFMEASHPKVELGMSAILQ